MRRKDREITDNKKLLEIMESCDCCRLGLVDGDSAYIVPLNFGFRESGGKITLYFHGASEGKKMDLLRKNELVGFEMDAKHGLMEGRTANEYSFFYQSIMGKGKVSFITDIEEKAKALQQIMCHYSGRGDWEFKEEALNRVAVWKLEVMQLSGKEH